MIGLILVAWLAALYYLYFLVAYRPRTVKGDVVLITGGGNGLGRQMALRFGALGCRVVLWDIDGGALQRVEAELRRAGVDCRTHVVDITDAPRVYEVAKIVGDVDILVNNAGIVTGKKMLECTDAHVERTYRVNAVSHFFTVRAFLPSMMRKRKGNVVTIASAAGLCGTAGLVDYCGSKFAAVGAHESLYFELKKERVPIRTTLVCPFYIDTGMFDGAKTKWPRLLPILKEGDVADRIVLATRRGEEMVVMPLFVNALFLVRVLPISWQYHIAAFFGIIDAMDDFKGRAGVKP